MLHSFFFLQNLATCQLGGIILGHGKKKSMISILHWLIWFTVRWFLIFDLRNSISKKNFHFMPMPRKFFELQGKRNGKGVGIWLMCDNKRIEIVTEGTTPKSWFLERSYKLGCVTPAHNEDPWWSIRQNPSREICTCSSLIMLVSDPIVKKDFFAIILQIKMALHRVLRQVMSPSSIQSSGNDEDEEDDSLGPPPKFDLPPPPMPDFLLDQGNCLQLQQHHMDTCDTMVRNRRDHSINLSHSLNPASQLVVFNS